MNVKEAVGIAKNYVADIFADEHITEIGLEEIETSEDGSIWHVTIGFKRPWKKPHEKKGPFELLQSTEVFNRWYKTVDIKDFDGTVIALRDREMTRAA